VIAKNVEMNKDDCAALVKRIVNYISTTNEKLKDATNAELQIDPQD